MQGGVKKEVVVEMREMKIPADARQEREKQGFGLDAVDLAGVGEWGCNNDACSDECRQAA